MSNILLVALSALSFAIGKGEGMTEKTFLREYSRAVSRTESIFTQVKGSGRLHMSRKGKKFDRSIKFFMDNGSRKIEAKINETRGVVYCASDKTSFQIKKQSERDRYMVGVLGLYFPRLYACLPLTSGA